MRGEAAGLLADLDAFYASVGRSDAGELRGRVVSIYMVAFRGGSPIGGLVAGWLVTQLGSAPMVLALNGALLTVIAVMFLVRGHGLREV